MCALRPATACEARDTILLSRRSIRTLGATTYKSTYRYPGSIECIVVEFSRTLLKARRGVNCVTEVFASLQERRADLRPVHRGPCRCAPPEPTQRAPARDASVPRASPLPTGSMPSLWTSFHLGIAPGRLLTPDGSECVRTPTQDNKDSGRAARSQGALRRASRRP